MVAITSFNHRQHKTQFCQTSRLRPLPLYIFYTSKCNIFFCYLVNLRIGKFIIFTLIITREISQDWQLYFTKWSTNWYLIAMVITWTDTRWMNIVRWNYNTNYNLYRYYSGRYCICERLCCWSEAPQKENSYHIIHKQNYQKITNIIPTPCIK